MKWNWQLKRDASGLKEGWKYHFILKKINVNERRSATSRLLIGAIVKCIFSKPFTGSNRRETE